MKKRFIFPILTALVVVTTVSAQNNGTPNGADRTLRGSGRVNASTLGTEFDLPLGSYPGRGINVPINLSYSSKVWRSKYVYSTPIPGGGFGGCHGVYDVNYAEDSASGWTTSLATPYVEYTGMKDIYYPDGLPVTHLDVDCPDTTSEPDYRPYGWIRRLTIHLPSGETHELRADDTVRQYAYFSNCVDSDPNTYCDGNDPSLPENWNATFYAVDGSNIRYVQDSGTNTYRLLMPDGSFYDFDSGAAHGTDRKATKFTDRNGNFTTYHAPDATYSNGRWTDTLGRTISVPVGLQAPAPTTQANPQVYSMPGMTGTYKLHWKNLKGNTAAESALTDFNQDLKFWGNRYVCSNPYPTFCFKPAGTYLFNGGDNIIWAQQLFNPVVLAEIELPTGQRYKFTYDVYGRIERIYYPTGGEERFQYAVVPTLAMGEGDSVDYITNFGVVDRKVYEYENDPTPYQWTYGASYTEPLGYIVTINNPDGTSSKRFLHRANNPEGTFGYDNVLAGMAYKEESYDDASPSHLVSQRNATWAKTSLSGADWNPRVTQEESRIYDTLGNGISATTTFEYEGDLNLRDTPVLMKKSSQYAFVPAGSPLPANPVRSSENTFLINDPNYAGVKSYYTAQNMVGLVTASQVKDGAGAVVSRSEMVYDESGRSPGYRGNPTTAEVWDSTKGVVTNTNAYIATSARFDQWGNQYEATDAKGNTATTTFDSTYHAFPISATSPVPSDGTYGSNTAFVTTSTFDTTTGLPLTTTDANGIETRIEYDPVMLRPLNTKTYYNSVQVGSTAETIYHDEPNNYWVKNRAQTDTNIWAESITYFDGLGRAWKTEEVNSKGNIFVEKEFDGDGRVLRVSNPFRAGETKVWTTNVYDEASRIKEVILQDGSTVKTDYGVSISGIVGVTKQITDQAGKKRKGISDALGRMVRVIEDPTGQSLDTDYVFDTLGNLRETVQGVQHRYFIHDSLGRLLYAKQPEQDANGAFTATDPITGNTAWSAKYEYDDNSNITRTTDARGWYVDGTYDNLDRLKIRNYSDPATPDVSFYYDGKGLGSEPARSKGKTTKVTSAVSETRYTFFDELGRLKNHQQITDGQTYSTEYEYNLSGGLIKETYPSGREIHHEINTDGDLSRVWGQKGSAITTYANAFNYNVSGAVEKMRLGNGKWETSQYNNRLQITQIGLGTGSNDNSLLRLEYSYNTTGLTNNNGSLREQKITVPSAGGSSGFTAIQTYSYDDLNRLQVAEEKISGNTTWKQTFVIDRYGNREFDAANTTTLGSCQQAACNPDISTSRNRFSDGQGYGYDQNGNVTQDAEGKRFGYDAENHQKEFFAVGNSSSVPDATYFYDGEGKRVKKISATETTVFVYNASGQLVAEYSTQIAQTPQVSYLTADHLGSPRVTSNQLGAVTDRKDYSAFGEETVSSQRVSALAYSSNSDELRKGYTGYEKDSESGLDFAQARYYNSTHGRYTSIDPLTASASIRNPQTLNRYSYVLNSPYKYVDPLGLISSSTGACGQWCQGSDGGGASVSGRDASFDHLKTETELIREFKIWLLTAPAPQVTARAGQSRQQTAPIDTQQDPPPLRRRTAPEAVTSYSGNPELESYSMEYTEVREGNGKAIELPDGNKATRPDGSTIKEHGPYVIVTYSFYDQGGSPFPGVGLKENVTKDKAEPEKYFGNAIQLKEFTYSNKVGEIYDKVGLLGDKRTANAISKIAYTVVMTQKLTVTYGAQTFQIVNRITMNNPDKKANITIVPVVK